MIPIKHIEKIFLKYMFLKRSIYILNPKHLDPEPEENINVNKYFHSSLWCLKKVLGWPLCHL